MLLLSRPSPGDNSQVCVGTNFQFQFYFIVFLSMNQDSSGFDISIFHCTGRVIICAYAPEDAMNEGSSKAENAANEGGEEAPPEGNQSTEAAATEQP